MYLHDLKPAKGAIHTGKRIGRGTGSNKGRNATRGTKGARSRSGFKEKRGFEGGQMPLQKRVPKFGFKNPNRTEYKVLNLERLEAIASKYNTDSIDPQFLISNKLMSKNSKVKVLGRGELSSKLNVQAHAFSGTAADAIEKAGGKVSKV